MSSKTLQLSFEKNINGKKWNISIPLQPKFTSIILNHSVIGYEPLLQNIFESRGLNPVLNKVSPNVENANKLAEIEGFVNTDGSDNTIYLRIRLFLLNHSLGSIIEALIDKHYDPDLTAFIRGIKNGVLILPNWETWFHSKDFIIQCFKKAFKDVYKKNFDKFYDLKTIDGTIVHDNNYIQKSKFPKYSYLINYGIFGRSTTSFYKPLKTSNLSDSFVEFCKSLKNVVFENGIIFECSDDNSFCTMYLIDSKWSQEVYVISLVQNNYSFELTPIFNVSLPPNLEINTRAYKHAVDNKTKIFIKSYFKDYSVKDLILYLNNPQRSERFDCLANSLIRTTTGDYLFKLQPSHLREDMDKLD